MKEKTKGLFHRLWAAVNDPRYEKPLLIALPCLALLLAALILIPQARELSAHAAAMQETGEDAEVSVLPAMQDQPLSGDTALPEELPPGRSNWRSLDGKTYYVDDEGHVAVGLKRIDGKICYFDKNGVKARSVGIDVSFYNEDIDWQAVKDYGIDFVIVRVGGRGWSTGLIYDDIRTAEYLREARAAGLKTGVYFYSTAINPLEAEREAEYAIRLVGNQNLELPIFIDMEYSGDYPEGRSDLLSNAERIAVITAFCETVRSAGHTPGVYSGQNFLKYSIGYDAISRYTIWLASYTVDNRPPGFSRRYDLWQFTDRGNVKGISGGVDMSVIF